MGLARRLAAPVTVPAWLALGVVLSGLLLLAWTLALVTDRNPLPFPDRDYAVFSARSERALVAMEEVMRLHGHRPRFRIDSDEVRRTLFSNGTIINSPTPAMHAVVGDAGAAIGFVVADPDASARAVAELLRGHGFRAEPVYDAEPGLPISFVLTDAMHGTALVFRKHVLEMGARPDAWTPRETGIRPVSE